ncbi:hypothetical protein VI06_21575 [Aquitalea magnusonii]|nr:hypothetical protein VI06_21575 [Aquitalea magnusonii]
MKSNTFNRLAVALLLAGITGPVLACASCGCTLSSDWDSQGFTSQEGLKLDIRYDYLNQNQLRQGTHSISAANASQVTTPGGGAQEVEKYTKNHYLTLGLDYAFSSTWGVNVQVPYIDRQHSTLGQNSDGNSPADGAYDSHTQSVGDIKVLGRYQGLTAQHNLGLLFGLKLPTGSHTQTGTSTDPTSPGGSASIDPGLQPGTGTTDLILGVYYFDALNKNWDYFAQATVQKALDTVDEYRPGTGYNVNVGVRYMDWQGITPQLQLNTRYVIHDHGSNADQVSTGGTLMYLSPGVSLAVNKQTTVYSFVQLPIYQKVNGVQLAPRYTASVGARFAF